MTLTTERLREIAEDGFLEHGDAKLMARELLANREAQPVVYMWDSERKDIDAPGYYRPEHLFFAENSVKKWGGRVVPLYTAPPAPQSTNAADWGINMQTGTPILTYKNCCVIESEQAHYVLSLINGAATPAPAVPDGFKLVPTVPTPEMIAAAMNCDDVTFNADETFCVNFGNIYAAMVAAAPEGGNDHDTRR